MDPTPISQPIQPFWDMKMILIVSLIAIIVLSYLGINLLLVFGNLLETTIALFSPLIKKVFGTLFQSTGQVINASSEIVAETSKTGIDIVDGVVKEIGDLLIDSANPGIDPVPDSGDNAIQKPLSATKTKWCLVGEYANKRGCIDIGESDKCLSGQVFPSEQMCLNPVQFQS